MPRGDLLWAATGNDARSALAARGDLARFARSSRMFRPAARLAFSFPALRLSLLLTLCLSADSSQKGRTRGRSGRPLLPSFPTAWRLPLLPLAAKTAASMSDPPKVYQETKYGILIEDAKTEKPWKRGFPSLSSEPFISELCEPRHACAL